MASTTVRMGDHELEMGGKYVTEFRDSSDLLGDGERLRERFAEDGYLFLRGFYDDTRVTNARNEVLHALDREGHLAPDTPLEEGVVAPGSEQVRFTGGDCEYRREFPNVIDLVESDRVFEFFERFLDSDPLNYDKKWVRAVPRSDPTDFHYDSVFMNRGTEDVYTAWSPLCDVPLEKGPLIVCAGSHNFEKLKDTYGQIRLSENNVEFGFTDPHEFVDDFGGQWVTGSFEAGDVIVFSIYTLHGALSNTTDTYRLSTDTRYQSREEPVDGYFVGQPATYGTPVADEDPTPLEEAREEWGV